MLEIKEDEIAPGRLEDMANARSGELDDEMPELCHSVCGHLLEAVIRHFLLPNLLG